VEQNQTPRDRSFIRELVPEWTPTRGQVLWTVRSVIVLVVLLGLLTLIGLPFGITLWEWLELLIVPAVIAGGGIWFNRQQRDEIAERRSQDATLQSYLDAMSQLLTDKDRPLRKSPPGDDLSVVARAQTLPTLARLDEDPKTFVLAEGARKGYVLQFLYACGLINKSRPVVNLAGANLIGAYLYAADLSTALLNVTNLSSANLSTANLEGADLIGANLSEANLTFANLNSASLIGADLQGANLTEAKLIGAKLRGAKVTTEQLELAESLEGATMPNGQKYEDWLKDKEDREEDEESSGPS